MSSDLKKLVEELGRVLALRGSSLDAPAREAFEAQVESLTRAIDKANVAERRLLTVEALKVMADLLSVVTNVMTLLK